MAIATNPEAQHEYSSSVTSNRYWWAALVAPVAYAVSYPLVIRSGGGDTNLVLWLTKFPAIISLVALVYLVARRVRERPSRWRMATLTWAGLGLLVIEIASANALRISRATSNAAYWRLWPTDDSERAAVHLGSIDQDTFVNWTVGNIVERERVAVVVLAFVAGLVLRFAAPRSAAIAPVAVPVGIVATLIGYAVLTPWSFIPDYDFFVGDSVLGATLFELIVFVGPVDPVSAVALGAAAVSMGTLVGTWRRPIPSN